MRAFIILMFLGLIIASIVTYIVYYTKRRSKKDSLKYLLRYTLIMTAALLALGTLRRYAVKDNFTRYKDVHITRYSQNTDYSFRILDPKLYNIDIVCTDGTSSENIRMLNVDIGYWNKFDELLDTCGSEMVIYQVNGTEAFFPVIPSEDSVEGARKAYYTIYPGKDPHRRSVKYYNMAVVFGGLSAFLGLLGFFYTRPSKKREPVLDLDEAVEAYLPDYYERQRLTGGNENRYVMVNDPSLYKQPKKEELFNIDDADTNFQVYPERHKEEKKDEPFIVRSPEDIFDPSLKSEEDILDARDDLLIREARRSRDKRNAKF